MIRTIRRVLYAILHSSVRLSDDVLNTVFCEAENIVNSRPMTKVSDDATDSEPLTPNHLLMLKGNFSLDKREGRKYVPTQMAACIIFRKSVLEALGPRIFARVTPAPEMAERNA